MVLMVCGQCHYSRKMTEREAEFGMLCPKCHCQYLRPPIVHRPGVSRSIRNLSIRLLIGGAIGLVVGLVLLTIGYNNLGGTGSRSNVFARFFAQGIVITGFSIISLISGIISLIRDLTQD